MKRSLIALAAALVTLAGCGPKPMTITGTIKDYDGDPEALYMFISGDKFLEDSIFVQPDGTFSYERMIEDVSTGFLSIRGKGTESTVFIPGEAYHYDIDKSLKPAIWTYSGKNKAEIDYYDYFKDATSAINVDFPDSFKAYSEYWDNIQKEASDKMAPMRNKKAIKYFKEKLPLYVTLNKISYAGYLRREGLRLDSDPDYNEFFNSIDLTDETNEKYCLNRMVDFKKDMYCDTISEIVRQLDAIRELSPRKEVADSLATKYLERIILDGKITTQYDANVLSSEVDNVITDSETAANYHAIIDKATTLFEGADALDFEMIDQSGKVIRLSDFKGKVVYIDFWATWCLPCCMEIPSMEKIAARYAGDRRIACISVSFDKDIASWESKLAFDKPQWAQYRTDDGGKAISLAYGFRGIPRFMLFDKNGKIVTVYAPRPSSGEELTTLIDSVLDK